MKFKKIIILLSSFLFLLSCSNAKDALQGKKNAMHKTPSFIFLSRSDLNPLTPGLRGEVDPGRPYPLIIPLS